MIFNESHVDGEAAEHSRQTDTNAAVIAYTQSMQLAELGERYAINGRIFGNLQGLEMIQGERVRWYLFSLGSETDLHTAHWHGLRVTESGHHTDVVELLPGQHESRRHGG